MTISLQTRTGNNNMTAAVGLLLFQNFWFWYPLTNFLSLALSPTTLIALNKDLQMPKMQFKSNAKPSTFAYPQPLQPEKEKKREKIETAVLSITAKQRKKEADRKQQKEQQQQQQQQKSKEGEKEEKMDVDAPAKEEKTTEEKKEEKEPNFLMLNNPARVMRAQQRVMALPETSRYYTLKPITQAGILMVHDRRPQDAEVLVELVHGHGPTGDRSITSASAAGTTGAAGLQAAGVGGSETRTEPIHASSIGAYLGDDEDDEDDQVDQEEEEDSSDVHEEEDEEDEEFAAAVAAQGVTDKSDVEMPATTGATTAMVTKRDKLKTSVSARRGKTSSSSNVEPSPPEPFLYVEEGAEAVTSAPTVPVTTTSATTAAKEAPSHEPMEVEEESAEGSSKKGKEDKPEKTNDTKK